MGGMLGGRLGTESAMAVGRLIAVVSGSDSVSDEAARLLAWPVCRRVGTGVVGAVLEGRRVATGVAVAEGALERGVGGGGCYG